jgi:hypothetical protein
MLPKRTLRASFVVTVTSGALVGIGCGSTVVSTPDASPPDAIINPPFDGPPIVDVAADSPDVLPLPDLGNPPAPDVPDAAVTSCPPSAPTPGGACDPTLSRVCTYGDCLGRPTTEARCAGGAWEVQESTCNPPPPEECPTTVPMPGAACTYVGPGCNYGTCPPSGPYYARCVSGRWAVVQASCNPPPDGGVAPSDAGRPPDA